MINTKSFSHTMSEKNVCTCETLYSFETRKLIKLISCLIFLAERLSELLMFTSGCRVIPPMGFSKPSLITVLQNESSFPNANTCPMELEVPGLVATYEEFKKNMNCALDSQKEGFGIV